MTEGNLRARFTSNVGKITAPAEELREHLRAAPSNQLLLVAVHVTRDTSLLDRYEDRVVGNSLMRAMMNSPDQQTDSPDARADLIEVLVQALSKQDQPDYLSVGDLKDLGLLGRMSDVAAGQPVPQAHLAMNLQQCGFEPDQRAVRPTRKPPGTLNLAIIGAGMTGLDAAVKAADRGFDFEVYEMESGTGGLWWSQTYPGVAVDTPSMVYSLSWEVTPNWSRFYPLGDEYRAYQQRPIRYEYWLTDKGEAFYPVLMALRAWGERWLKAPDEGPATNYVHRDCGRPAGLGPLCEGCGRPLTRANIISRQSPAYAQERADRVERFKAAK